MDFRMCVRVPNALMRVYCVASRTYLRYNKEESLESQYRQLVCHIFLLS